MFAQNARKIGLFCLSAFLIALTLAAATPETAAEDGPAANKPAAKKKESAGQDYAEPAKPKEAPKPQYEHKDIRIEAASADEPVRAEFSAAAAVEHLEQGAVAWGKANNCISCHTNGSYLRFRPGLSNILGQPTTEVRDLFLAEKKKYDKLKEKQLKKDIRPTITAYLAAGLAEWDTYITGELSPETESALALMFAAQADDGSWNNQNCWPPIESSAYHAATVAAMACATAPGWLDKVTAGEATSHLAGLTEEKDQWKAVDLAAGVAKMKKYLRETRPPHDYGRLLLLWASTRVDDLLDETGAAETQDMIFGHQNADGGWSMRSFSAPEKWGAGIRAARLNAEDEATRTASDGHQTGLCVLVLRAAGVPADDARIQKAVTWLKSNQRESGRWWTRSLNTDRSHYITYTGTMYPVAALAACGELKLPPAGLAAK